MKYGFFFAAVGLISINASFANKDLPVNYDDFLKFTDASQCIYAHEFEKFADSFFKSDTNGVALKGEVNAPFPYKDAITNHKYTRGEDGLELTINVNAIWHGFKLLEISSLQFDGGEPSSISWIIEGNHKSIVTRLLSDGFEFNENGHALHDDPNTVYDLRFYVIQDTEKTNITEISCYWL